MRSEAEIRNALAEETKWLAENNGNIPEENLEGWVEALEWVLEESP